MKPKYKGMPDWEYRPTKGFIKSKGFMCETRKYTLTGTIGHVHPGAEELMASMLLAAKKQAI